jgi:hypothetical protein
MRVRVRACACVSDEAMACDHAYMGRVSALPWHAMTDPSLLTRNEPGLRAPPPPPRTHTRTAGGDHRGGL